MRYRTIISALSLAVAVATVSEFALAQDSGNRDRPWWRHGWAEDWGMMGPGMMGHGMMGMMGHGMMGVMGHGMMPMMFVMMDTDSDGAVSLEEMQVVQKRMFDLVDMDKDGQDHRRGNEGFQGRMVRR